MSDLLLERVPLERKPALRRMLTEYLAEFDAMEGIKRERDAEGNLPYTYFDQYWTDSDRTPLGIWLAHEFVGFCLLRDTGERWHVAEFYVVPEHRRQGIGSFAAEAVKNYCRAAARHRQLEASTLRFNTDAVAFWRSRGFVTVSEEPERLISALNLDSEPTF